MGSRACDVTDGDEIVGFCIVVHSFLFIYRNITIIIINLLKMVACQTAKYRILNYIFTCNMKVGLV